MQATIERAFSFHECIHGAIVCKGARCINCACVPFIYISSSNNSAILHFFSANIGMAREGDKRWITQYGALFAVLNSLGQVVTWKLATGVSFSVIQDILIPLRRRLEKQGKHLSEFYVDNCCSWRRKLQEVFGQEVKVRLDVFHAVKRVSEKVPKRHHLRRECLIDWSMVFRDSTDHGLKRCKATPDPATLESNLDKFYSQWKDAKYDDTPVLNAAALKEISNIKKHMRKGCLSGIQPGRGTNRNESLHKDLNNIMSSSRYGVELAYALFTVCFYKHNERMASNAEKRSAFPVEYYLSTTDSHELGDEKFGLSFESVSTDSSTSASSSLHVDCCTYEEMYSLITDTPRCHKRQETQILADSDCDDDPDDCDQQHLLTSPAIVIDDSNKLCTIALKHILIKVLTWYFAHKAVTRMSNTACFNIIILPPFYC